MNESVTFQIICYKHVFYFRITIKEYIFARIIEYIHLIFQTFHSCNVVGHLPVRIRSLSTPTTVVGVVRASHPDLI